MDKILLKFHLKKEILSAGLLTYLIAFQQTFETDTLFPNPYVTIKSISNQIVKKLRLKLLKYTLICISSQRYWFECSSKYLVFRFVQTDCNNDTLFRYQLYEIAVLLNHIFNPNHYNFLECDRCINCFIFYYLFRIAVIGLCNRTAG